MKDKLLSIHTQSSLDAQCATDVHPHVELTENLRWACVNCRETVAADGHAKFLVGV